MKNKEKKNRSPCNVPLMLRRSNMSLKKKKENVNSMLVKYKDLTRCM